MNTIIKLIKEHGKIPIIISVIISSSFYFLYLKNKDESESSWKQNSVWIIFLMISISSIGIYYNCKKTQSCPLLKDYYKPSLTEPISIQT